VFGRQCTVQHCYREDNSWFVVKAGKSVHDEILDKQDLPEKEIVQFAHEGRYENS
jgi:hypothetical protein